MLKYKKKREYEVIMTIDIPGYRTLHLKNLLLDYNGTIAVDGSIPQDVRHRLCQLSEHFDIYVLTADTHGTAAQMCDGLPLTIRTFPKGSALDAKHQILKELGPDSCAAIGNGRNDMKMCLDAALSIAVIGPEGAYGKLAAQSDICVSSIVDGLDLLLKPRRLIASLRG